MQKAVLKFALVFLLLWIFPVMLIQAVEPGMTYAPTNSVDTLVSRVQTTLNSIIGVLFIIATLVFLWGLVHFIANAGDETKRSKAKAVMTWGIIGLAVMAAAWGVTNVLVGFFLGPGGGPVRGRIPIRPGDL